MRIAYAFLAKYGDTGTDGTFALVGGGLEVVRGERLPVGVPALTVVVHLFADPPECGHEHHLVINIVNPHGDISPFRGDLPFTPLLDQERPDRQVGVNCLLGILGASFTEEGDYEFRLSVDGVLLSTTSLTVTLLRAG
jgi:hypothetical protein